MSLSDSQTGTPVTLVVQPPASTPGTGTPPPPGKHGHLPFTGLDVMAAVLLAVLLLALGCVLLAGSLLPARLVPSRVRTTHSRRNP
jgi:hypothetical protein